MKAQIALDKFRDYMRLRHLALSTEQSYLAWLARYIRFLEEGAMGYLHAESLSVRSPLEVMA